MRMLNGKFGLGMAILLSCAFFSHFTVHADITDEQKELIKIQVEKNEGEFIPGELIVGLTGNNLINSNEKKVSNLFGINAEIIDDLTLKTSVNQRREPNQVLLIRFPEQLELSQVINQLNDLPEVEYAEPNYIVQSDEVEIPTTPKQKITLNNPGIIPNDTHWDKLWGLNKIDMPLAWNTNTGSSNVKVAVIDSGIDDQHEDLAGNVDARLGYDFVDNDPDPQDEHGHGTHVAGTIGAQTNNGLGVAGVSWNVTMVPIRVLNASNKGSVANIVKGINWATEKKIPIANYSINGNSYSRAREEAIENYPGLFVGAAGNKGDSLESTPQYPAASIIPNMITVGNSDETDARYSGSSYSKTKVDLFAPGTKIYSTLPGGNAYGYKTGTSMAAPHVTGSAALALAQDPSLSTSELKTMILESVDKMDSLAEFCLTGGRLNTAKLLLEAGLPEDLEDTEAPTTPQNFTVESITSKQVQLSWSESSDNDRVKQYNLSLVGGGKEITTSTSDLSYTFNELNSNTAYTVTLTAEDRSGNVSEPTTITFMTLEDVATDIPKWGADTIYVAGDRVMHEGLEYEAKWWTKNDVPSESGEYGPWRLVTS